MSKKKKPTAEVHSCDQAGCSRQWQIVWQRERRPIRKLCLRCVRDMRKASSHD